MGEKIKEYLFEALLVIFISAISLGIIKWIDQKQWEYINGEQIVILTLVTFWLKNTIFKK